MEENELQSMADAIRSAVDNANTNTSVSDEDKADPTHQLYQKILMNTANIFDQPDVQSVYAELSGAIGKGLSMKLMSVITTVSASSAMTAISLYNDLVMSSFEGMDKAVAEALGDVSTELSAVKDAVAVLRSRITDLSNKMTVNNIMNDAK